MTVSTIIDLHLSRRVTIETEARASSPKSSWAAKKRSALHHEPSRRFRCAARGLPDSLQILDDKGTRIRTPPRGRTRRTPTHRQGGIVNEPTRSRPWLGIMARRWRCLHTGLFQIGRAHQDQSADEDALSGTITITLRFRAI